MGIRRWAIAFGALIALVASAPAATLMPNGKQQFIDGNGVPLAGGFVYMYQPNTTVCKNSWTDAAQTTLNTCPIVLDANGEAIIYGTGTYSQEVQDSLGNLIWNQFTTDTSASNSVFWAGTSAGTPNVITIVDANFNGTDGSVIQFVAGNTNTSSATLNPSSFGAITIVKDTTAGPVVLTGGEIIAGNIISVVYDAAGNRFHLLNAVIASASGASAPLCGATGLVITNGSTPNSIAAITARQVVMQTTAGFTINRSNVSVTVNTSLGNATATAGGMDGEAPGTSAWIDLFVIDNGSAPSGLGSLAAGNGLAPNMPTGYTYKCYLGAMRVDGSGNFLRTRQAGSFAQYQVTSATNTTVLPLISNTTSAAYSSASVSSFVPPTATHLNLIGTTSGASQGDIAPNNSYNVASVTSPSPCAVYNGGGNSSAGCLLELETSNIFIATSTGTLRVFAIGWKDSVNAN